MFPKDKAINKLVFFTLGTLSAWRPLSFEHEYSSNVAFHRTHVLNQSTNNESCAGCCSAMQARWAALAMASTVQHYMKRNTRDWKISVLNAEWVSCHYPITQSAKNKAWTREPWLLAEAPVWSSHCNPCDWQQFMLRDTFFFPCLPMSKADEFKRRERKQLINIDWGNVIYFHSIPSRPLSVVCEIE